jgi:hypothetical protein
LFADHGRADWLGYWDEFVQIARFKNWFVIKQNDLIYLERVFDERSEMRNGQGKATLVHVSASSFIS